MADKDRLELTTEEIVMIIKDGGHDEMYAELWGRIVRLVEIKTKLKARSLDRYSEVEDMLQECFVRLPKAVECFSCRGMTFQNYFLKYHMPKAHVIALYGIESRRTIAEPIYHAMSIDEEIDMNGDEVSIMDTIIDPSAEQSFEEVDDLMYWDDVHQFIKQGLKKSTDELGKGILLKMLELDYSYSDTVRKVYGGNPQESKYRAAYDRGKRFFRSYCKGEGKKRFDELEIEDLALSSMQSYGVGAYIRTGTSNIERITIRRMTGEWI